MLKAIVEGDLIINRNLKLVFDGSGMKTRLFVKGDGANEWHWIQKVANMNLRVDPQQSLETIMLTIEVAVENAEGTLIAQPQFA